MIWAGKNITGANDKLYKISVDYLYHELINPKLEVATKIRQLRAVRDLDVKRYALLKKELPYIVCSTFNPAFRKTENFVYTEYFIIDIDHISQKELNIDKIQNGIIEDSRVVLCFKSPSGDGLKVLFKLKEKCQDSGLFSIFYKIFVTKFSEQYHLEQVVDRQTSDVCRACFISIDKNAYYNENAMPIDINIFVDLYDTSSLFTTNRECEKRIRQQTLEQKTNGVIHSVDPDIEQIEKIKGILAFQRQKTEKAPVVVPQQLESIMGNIETFIEENGVQVTEIINIQYGKKIRAKLGIKLAEVNLFYGKRGFSVVESPRCGTNAELNSLLSDLINAYLATH